MRALSGTLMVLLMVGMAITHVSAKRGAPKDVAPVTHLGIIYSAPHDQMGFVVAQEEKTSKVLWSKQIYVVKYDNDLEKDVQDCFITELRVADGKLIVSNERGGEFELNPATHEVKVLKGEVVVEKKQ